jgi:hypothetical protein
MSRSDAIKEMKGIIRMTKPKDPKAVDTADLKEDAPESAPESTGAKSTAKSKPVSKAGSGPAAEAESKPDTEPAGEVAKEAADEAAPSPEPETPREPAHDEPAHHHEVHLDPHDDEHGHRSLAATALTILVGVLFIASLTLWAAPKIAPHMPAGVAQYLMPGQVDTDGRLSSLEEALASDSEAAKAKIAALEAEIAALSGRVDAAADTGETETAIAAVRSDLDAASADAAAAAARLDAIGAEIDSLRGEFSALSETLAAGGSGEGASAPELAAAVAALGARLDKLAGSVEGAAADRVQMTARLDAVESSAADARDVQSEALGEVSTAIHQARLQSAIDLLASRLTGGLPYAAKLNEVATLTGEAPPEPLSAGADAGLATAAALEASFARHAQAAVAADVQASAGDGTGSKALGWLRAQVAGRPVSEQEGDGVGAVTSRIAARVSEGKLSDALAEARTLPEHAQAGLGEWLEQLRARVDADTALAEWRAAIGAGG